MIDGRKGLETRLGASSSSQSHHTAPNTHTPSPPLSYHIRNSPKKPSPPDAAVVAWPSLETKPLWMYQSNFILWPILILSIGLCQMVNTLTWQFVAGGREVKAGFYAMIIIVECGRAGQILVVDGWMLAVGGRGVICAHEQTVLSEIPSLPKIW